jgi:hypothetical protein
MRSVQRRAEHRRQHGSWGRLAGADERDLPRARVALKELGSEAPLVLGRLFGFSPIGLGHQLREA